MEAAAAFALPGPVEAVEPHPSGHINDAFLVVAGGDRFLLQRVNPTVFPDPDAVMANIATVTEHLAAKGEPTLSLVAWQRFDGEVWRVYRYIDGVRPLDVRSPADAAAVGRAYGRFHRLLADLDPAQLRVSLPGFHDPARRLAALDATVEQDACGRGAEAAGELAAVAGLRELADRASILDEAPLRVAHYDAKAANVLVDNDGDRAPVVVDLDTVMPGSVLWDVGDMVRSTTPTTDEDGGTPRFDVDRYGALLDAYREETRGLLTDAEWAAMPLAGPVITYEQSVRFLTDHLRGDVYFRVERPGQNLDRARNQLALLTSMLDAL